MAKNSQIMLSSVLLALAIAMPAVAQSNKPLATSAELSARLKEAEGDPKLAEALFKTGRKVAAVCANCHGEGGQSLKPDIPNLAGQNPSYLLDQISKFADGRRRFEFMEGMIKAMTSDEKVGMVLFYTAQKVPHTPASNPALAAKGKDYYGKICFRCHGETGMGSNVYARLAGQQSQYLKVTINHYRTGTGGRTDPLMAANTKLMSDADIDAVVAFISSM